VPPGEEIGEAGGNRVIKAPFGGLGPGLPSSFGGPGTDALDAGTLGSPNTKGNSFVVAPLVHSFDHILS
jgi:hypothetical protein